MSLLKIPFTLTAGLAMHAISTAPHSSELDETERVPPTGLEHLISKTIPLIPVVAKALDWVWTFIEIATIVASCQDPSSSRSTKILFILVANKHKHPALAASKIRITPVFIVGWLLVISGSLIRLACYRELGNLFTFHLSMRKDHKLITSGPYSVVRHPSYTGAMMAVLGFFLCNLSSGSWMRECSGLLLKGGRVLLSVAVVLVVTMGLGLVARTYKEDDMLRKEFKEWDEWAEKVPWKMVPFVY